MIRSKKIEIFSIFCIILATVIAIVMSFQPIPKLRTPAEKLKAQISDEYSSYLFDSSYVHEINIIISDLNWDYMTKHATDEQYVQCDVEIDGETIRNIAIRPKGNSSLSAISNSGGTHFSFKIEFDKYNKEQTYHGLDKLALGNLGQDPSCMKDFLAYHMMNEMDVPAPLSSYTLVKLNGEDFGLYLAVETVDDSFCYRNYGEDYGQLYKPDSFSMDSMNLGEMLNHDNPDSPLSVIESIMDGRRYADKQSGDRVDIIGDMVIPVFAEVKSQTDVAALNYVGDNTEDYYAIFDTAIFDITETDKRRLVNAVRILNTSDNSVDALDTEILLKYFAVHDFVNNYDSYNSLFVHNFYLHEKDGKLSLIPWDYNLAFGTFSYESAVGSILGDESSFDYMPNKGNAMSNEKSMVNYPIDTPTYSISLEERPLLNVLLTNDETLTQYHDYLNKLLSEFMENGDYDRLFSQIYEQIKPYAEQGLTPYTSDKFEAGVEAINQYCHLRTKSVRGQLDGTIPSTTYGQRQMPETLVNTNELNLINLTNFNSLVAGIDTETISNALNIVLQDNYNYDTQGAVNAVKHYVSNPFELIPLIPKLLKIPAIRKIIGKKIPPYIGAIVSFIVMLVGLAVIKRYNRRRNNATQT
ncbi:MAG: CotH kinase family protein [Oscillospiraceae bacterium]|nr:CotH kinase family protein [Oscillospiraceae bacterium]